MEDGGHLGCIVEAEPTDQDGAVLGYRRSQGLTVLFGPLSGVAGILDGEHRRPSGLAFHVELDTG
ncbi:MAG: hypothetical protein ABWX68_08960 [Arthrobacter sp.]|uniref:hypothetical protein n=1 Tax=Arthrobacter sp. TaxID=1667 RepID=UPI003499A2C4